MRILAVISWAQATLGLAAWLDFHSHDNDVMGWVMASFAAFFTAAGVFLVTRRR
jgi:hypothetical protein